MKYFEFFKERIPGLPSPNEKGECVVPCIFHDDKNPSLAVNVETGKWKCYTPHCQAHAGGGWKKFDQLMRGEIAGSTGVSVPPIDDGAIEGFHSILLQTKSALSILTEKCALTMPTIVRFKLGWDGDRILIPIRGPEGSWVNVNKYKYGGGKDKMISWAPHYNRARLFPFENIAKSDTIYIFEGHTDCLLANQLGYCAITATNGADTWLDEFNEQLAGKHVILCYDMDKAGLKAVRQVAIKLLPTAASVRIVKLPLSGSKVEKDFRDYIQNLGHTKAEFDVLVEKAESVEQTVSRVEPDAQVEEIHLSAIGLDKYVGKRVRSTVLIAGKDLAPFQVPIRVAYSCAAVGSEKMCDRCGICKSNGQKEVNVPIWSPELLQMVNVPIEKLNAIVGRLADVPERCPKYTFEIKEHRNVESVKAIPEIDYNAAESEYVIRNLFYLGHGIGTNRTYKIEGVVMPEPKTQYATALIYDAAPSRDTIEKFELTPELHEQLQIFQVDHVSPRA